MISNMTYAMFVYIFDSGEEMTIMAGYSVSFLNLSQDKFDRLLNSKFRAQRIALVIMMELAIISIPQLHLIYIKMDGI